MKPQWYYCYRLFCFFRFFFPYSEVFNKLCSCGAACQAGDVSVIEASAADEFEFTVLMPHPCVNELRKWGQTVWLLCIFPCWQHTDLLAVNTRVTYIIFWSVRFLHPEWEWTKHSSLNLFCHANMSEKLPQSGRRRDRERENPGCLSPPSSWQTWFCSQLFSL